MSTDTIEPEPIDPDGPEPMEDGGTHRWGIERLNYWLAHPEPAFTWDQIRVDAHQEFTSRIAEISDSKNSAYSDWLLDNWERFTEDLPDDLLIKTQGYTNKNHEVIKDA